MEERAQVQMEMMLILAGVIVVVTVVTLFIKTTANTVGGTAQDAAKKP